jgi:hypothetical protein
VEVTVLVFISWSGRRSRAVANVLRDWIDNVLPTVDVWMSDRDLEAGTRWGPEVQARLDQAEFGIVVITNENMTRPWLNFEAGAISKSVGADTRVVPFLVDATGASELPQTHPLSQFQALLPTADGMTQLITSINSLAERSLSLGQLTSQLAMYVPQWQQRFQEATTATEAATTTPPPRATDDMLRELLDLTRSIHRVVERAPAGVSTRQGSLDFMDAVTRAENFVTYHIPNVEAQIDPFDWVLDVITEEPLPASTQSLLQGQLMGILPEDVGVRFRTSGRPRKDTPQGGE